MVKTSKELISKYVIVLYPVVWGYQVSPAQELKKH